VRPDDKSMEAPLDASLPAAVNTSTSTDRKKVILPATSSNALRARTIVVKGMWPCKDDKYGQNTVRKELKRKEVDDDSVESIRIFADEKNSRSVAIVRFKEGEKNREKVQSLFYSSYLATRAASMRSAPKPSVQFWRDRPFLERKAFQAKTMQTQSVDKQGVLPLAAIYGF